ncbi:MAG: hypothetical protein R3E82_03455 [Pseudomonadales bacterium]
MNPVGQSRSGTLPQLRVPDFRPSSLSGNVSGGAAVAGGAASTGAEDVPRLRRISGATGASQDAMLHYGSAAQIRNATVSGSHIDLYV